MSGTKLLSLSEIFNNRIFRIPDFQRGYSWEDCQLEDIWEDIQNLHPNKIHYIGMLTVKPIKKDEMNEKWKYDQWLANEEGMSAYYVIDGQQRLTTLIILLHEILCTLKNDEDIFFRRKKSEWTDCFLYRSQRHKYKSFVFGYEKGNPSDEFFKTEILEQESAVADKCETLYTANLKFAKNYFKEKIKNLSKESKEDIFAKTVNRLKFNYYEIDDSLDVYVTYETMNNRGKDLSHLELLKNRLIYLSTLLPNDTDDKGILRDKINDRWKTIYEYLGKNKKKPLKDDDFLYNHWIIYFQYDRNQSYDDFLLKRTFTSKNVISGNISYDDIEKYTDSLRKCVKPWFNIHNIQKSDDYSYKIKEHVQKLERLGWGAFRPLIMAVFSKEKIENNEDLIYNFLVACERFQFLVFDISQYKASTKRSHLFIKAHEYYKKDENLDVEKLTDHIVSLTYSLTGGDSDKLGTWFKNCIEDHFKRSNGFYSWSGLKYFLYEYELYLQRNVKGDVKVTWESVGADTIEHIYPQLPTDPYWSERFDHLTDEEKKKYLNSLGNLLLLSRSKNSTLQNYDFEKKKRLTNKDGIDTGYYNGSYSEIEVSKQEEWTPREIIARGLSMLQFMEERWNFKFEDKEIKKEEILIPPK